MRQFVMTAVVAAAAVSVVAGCKDDKPAGPAAGSPAAAVAKRDTPQAAAKAFIDAVSRNDMAAAKAVVSRKVRDRHAADFDKWAGGWRDELAGATLTGDAEPIAGSADDQRVGIKFLKNGKEKTGHVTVRRDGGEWYWDDN